MVLDHLEKRIKNIDPKYLWNIKTNVVLFLLAAHALFWIIVLIFFLWCLKHLESCVRIFKHMSGLLLEKYRSNELSTSHECMTKFVMCIQSCMLPQLPTVDDTASTSTVSHFQDTIEMTDFADDSDTNITPAILPKVGITPELLQYAAEDFAK